MARRKRKYKLRKPRKRKDHRDPPMPVWFFNAQGGMCRWCNGQIFKPDGTINTRRLWHPDCLDDYFIITRQSYAKRAVKKRDKGICAKCGTKCNLKTEWDLDHIKPLIEAKGDLTYWRLGNLQTLCKKCHKLKTGAENSERMKKRGKRDN